MRFLVDTGNAVRIGILLSLFVAGCLYVYDKVREKKFEAYEDAYALVFRAAGEESHSSGNEQMRIVDEWVRTHPSPGLPPTLGDLVEYWSIAIGAYVFTVVVAQLRHKAKTS